MLTVHAQYLAACLCSQTTMETTEVQRTELMQATPNLDLPLRRAHEAITEQERAGKWSTWLQSREPLRVGVKRVSHTPLPNLSLVEWA